MSAISSATKCASQTSPEFDVGRGIPRPDDKLCHPHELPTAGQIKNTAAPSQIDLELLKSLIHSKIFADYERAFTEATGLPIALRPVSALQLPFHGKRNECAFCGLMAGKSRSCGS